MSTKTSFKRIALVAASALAIAGFSAVPANAAAITTATYTSAVTNTGNTGTAALPIPSGTALTADLTLTTNQAGVAADTGTMTFTVTAGPASKDITSTCTFTATAATITGLTSSTLTTAATGTFTIVLSGAGALTAAAIGTVSCPTTIGGDYVITPTGALTTPAVTPTKTAVTAKVSGLNVSQGTTRSTTAGTAQNGGNANVIWTLPTRTAATDVFKVVSSGVGSIQGVASAANATVTTVSGTAGDFSQGARVVSTAADTTTLTSANITATSTAAGTQTLSTFAIDSTTGVVTAIGTATIVWGATPVATASTSTAFLSAGEDCATADDAAGVTLSKTAGVTLAAGATTGAAICIAVLDQNGVAINGQALTVTVAGPGLITLATGNGVATTGTVRAASLTATTQAATNLARVGVSADGTQGTSTITISTGTTVLATKTVTFFGTVATLTVKQNLTVASKAGAALGTGVANPTGADVAHTPAVIITAKDSNGNAVPSLTITAKSSDTTVMSETITINGDDGTGLGNGAGSGSYNVAVNSTANTSGKTATLTFRVMSGTTVVAASEAVKFTLGGGVNTVALSLDKALYSIGAAAVATLTVKDSSGNAAFDADHVNILASSSGLSSSLALAKTLFGATTVSTTGGVATASFNAPTVATDWTISTTTGVGPGTDIAKALSASATVEGDQTANLALDAANAATDAANNAYDEAQNATQAASDALAAVTALAAQVKSLIASVKKLTAAVAKLKK